MLKEKVVLITGATKGIGLEIARAFAKEGASLCLHGRDQSRLAEVQKELCNTFGVRTETVTADLLEDDAPRRILDSCAAKFGRLDILVNNAGIMEPTRVENTTEDCFERHMRVNVYAPYFLCKYALPMLRQSDMATIFNICSIVSVKGYENQSVYSVSKHALYGLTKVLSRESFEDDIRVYAIVSGLVSTEMSLVAARPDVDLSTLTDPGDLADWLVFMATHRSTAIVDEITIRRPGKKAFQ